MTPPKPSRRRLTQAEFDAELSRARTLPSGSGKLWIPKDLPPADPEAGRQFLAETEAHLSEPLRTRTGRRRSWWQRGWKR